MRLKISIELSILKNGKLNALPDDKKRVDTTLNLDRNSFNEAFWIANLMKFKLIIFELFTIYNFHRVLNKSNEF